jgi:hypothetical protein
MAKQQDVCALTELIPVKDCITVKDRKIPESVGARYNIKRSDGGPVIVKITDGKIKFDAIRRDRADAKASKKTEGLFTDKFGRDRLNVTISCSKKEYKIVEEIENYVIRKVVEMQNPDAGEKTITKKVTALKESSKLEDKDSRQFSSKLFASDGKYEEDYGIVLGISYKDRESSDLSVAPRILLIDEQDENKMTEIRNPNVSTVKKYFRYDSPCSVVFNIPSIHVGRVKTLRAYLQYIQVKPTSGTTRIDGTPFGGNIAKTKVEDGSGSEEEQAPRPEKRVAKASVKAILKPDKSGRGRNAKAKSESGTEDSSEPEKVTKSKKPNPKKKTETILESSGSESDTKIKPRKKEGTKVAKKKGEEPKVAKKKESSKSSSDSETKIKKKIAKQKPKKKKDLSGESETESEEEKTKKTRKKPITESKKGKKKSTDTFTLDQVLEDDE